MENFSDFKVWGWMILFAVLLGSLLMGNVVKKVIPPLKASLIPTSVIGGIILLIVAAIYKAITGDVMFDTELFGEAAADYVRASEIENRKSEIEEELLSLYEIVM